MYYGIGILILLIAIIVLIRFLMCTGETTESCSVDNQVSPNNERPDDEAVEASGIEIDLKDQK